MTGPIAHLSCQEFVELVTDYLDGALDDPTRERFDHHMELCPGCGVYLHQMEETAARLGTIPAESLSPEAQETLLDAFRGFRR
ncbi:MAG: zf-HC2 domain-containing protein [Nocardioidaceae bacterium]